MPVYVTPEYLNELQQAVVTDVLNRGTDIALDRYEMPLLARLWDKRDRAAGHANDKTRVNWSQADDREKLQYWSGLDRMSSTEIFTGLYGEFQFRNIAAGLNIKYTDLMAEGHSVIFSDSGRAQVKKNSPDDVNILWNAYKRKVETFQDRFKVLLNRELYYTDNPDGIDTVSGFISLDPTAGYVGGKSRAGNPILQHTVRLGLTTGAGGTLWKGMTQGIRIANTNKRGRSGQVDLLVCGSEFLDGVDDWQQANGFRITSDAGKDVSVNLGVKDNARKFLGMPLLWDPTLDKMQQAGVPDDGTPWTKRCYGICTEGLEVRCPSGMDYQVHTPPDPRDQRFQTTYIDTRLALVNTIPNAHVLFSIA